MSLPIEEFVKPFIVRIVCGSESGTGFFIAPNKLLTALHVVSDAIVSSSPVEIFYKDSIIIGSVSQLAAPGETVDVAIVEISIPISLSSGLKLLSLTLNTYQNLFTIGFPVELAGCETPFPLKLRHVYSLPNRVDGELFVKKSDVSFFSYEGYSGAPVLNASGSVVGILAMQENQNLKAISISNLIPYLNTRNIPYVENDLFEDDSPHGLKYCQEILDRAITKAGSKYNRDVHHTNPEIEDKIVTFIDADIVRIYNEQEAFAASWCKNHSNNVLKVNYKSTNDCFEDISEFLESYIRTYYSLKNDRRLPIDFKNEDRGIEIKDRLYSLRKKFTDATKLIFGIFGVAGCGKTHTSCWLAEELLKRHNHVYYLYGTDFNVHELPDKQIMQILNFSKDDLNLINAAADQRNKKVLFVIDAINEGPGYSYWKDNLSSLVDFIKQYEHFKLLITGRQVGDGIESLICELNLREISTILELEGFSEEDLDEVKVKYADKFGFPLSRFNDISIDLTNPLILLTFCKSQRAKFRFDSSKANKLSVYSDYLVSKNVVISDRIDVDPKRDVTIEASKRIAHFSVFNAGFKCVGRHIAYKICNRIVNRSDWSKNLLNQLIAENILSEQFQWLPYKEQSIDFEFQNIGDTLRAKELFDSKMDTKSLLSFIIKSYKEAEGNRENIWHALISMLGLWDFSKRPDLTIDIIKGFNRSLQKEVLVERGKLNPIIEEIWKGLFNELKFFDVFRYLRFLSIDFIFEFHNYLKQIPLTERDIKNIIDINRVYEIERHSFYHYLYSNRIIDEPLALKYCIYCAWLGSSSHPDFRAVLKREITKIFFFCPNLIIKLFDLFSGINDSYIEELVICSIYGGLLVLRNKNIAKEVAVRIEKKYYSADGEFPRNLLVRQWTELIIEFASYLNPNLKFYINKRRSQTPNPLTWNFTEVDEKKAFGDSLGGKYLRSRLFRNGQPGIPSDFNRYIIGTNNRLNDRYLQTQDGKFIPLDDITNMIAIEIINLGWNDKIGNIDTVNPPFDRFGNETEKISKKYLWIAYQNVMALLSDHCKFSIGEYFWDQELKPIDNVPAWVQSGSSYFDPTLMALPNPTDKSITLTFAPDFSNLEHLISDEVDFPAVTLSKSIDNFEWLLLDGWDGKSINSDDFRKIKNINYQYISWIIKDWELENLREEIVKNTYMDLPDVSENRYTHLWNEYPWSEKSKIGKYKWSNIGIGKTLGMPLSIIQLQEDMQGIDYENQPLSNAYCPNWEIMDSLHLYTAERGIVRCLNDNSIVAFNRNLSEISCGGLVVRKDLLDTYLKMNGASIMLRIEYYKSSHNYSCRAYDWVIYSPDNGFEELAPRLFFN